MKITDSRENYRVADGPILDSRATPDCPVEWSVTKTTLRGGRQEGVELITVDNGAMQIVVVPTRGMGVLDVRHGDVRMGWDSPIKDVVHPQFINLQARNNLGWLEGFNEWMVRCGLESAGQPGPDSFVTNTGAVAEMDLPLHGKIANIPASQVEVEVEPSPPYRIHLRGVVQEHMFYGPKLTLKTDITTEPGSSTLRITDEVTNAGGSPQEMQLIYHTNYGRPILEEGAQYVVPHSWRAPMNDEAAAAFATYAEYGGPQEGFVEVVYLLRPLADEHGQTAVLLKNRAGDLGATIRWKVDQLPYLTIWKNTSAEADGYVTGLEPGTGHPFHRSVERKAGRVPKLAPGETRRFELDFGLHIGDEAVAHEEAWITRVQADQQPEVQTTPPE